MKTLQFHSCTERSRRSWILRRITIYGRQACVGRDGSRPDGTRRWLLVACNGAKDGLS